MVLSAIILVRRVKCGKHTVTERKKRRIHDDRVKVNDRKNPSKSKEESRQFEKRKKVLFDFINDDLYVPMKIKEIAVVLQIPGEQRQELREVLDALVEEGKITISKRGKIYMRSYPSV